MGERKNLNKYYSPDFDPSKIPRLQKPKNQQKKIRFMLPVRVRCNTCGNYMSQGTKFNCREEDVINETHVGIEIFRFYIKCINCLAEVTIKTDPKNHGYTVESGATSLYNGHEVEEEKETEENALECLERRSVVSKREMEVKTTLDELKSMKSRRASVSVESMLEALSRRRKQEEENVEEELLIKSIKFGKRITRVDDEEEDKNYEVFDEKKKKKSNKRRDFGKSRTRQISCVRC
ncbi:hypothetical protein CARUB_v10019391mg [Capsella rubella]|uniref:Splicing factor YJU2 n=1 Tax=Capsella rubella TaxID=81985 RepID=R0FU30_9BRAS|nr:coiled-coil domain-containing protein 94 [Capsella rubella]EOA25996.1 hypothetical protein CARUB_v10019391mg [Capsella rubella]